MSLPNLHYYSEEQYEPLIANAVTEKLFKSESKNDVRIRIEDVFEGKASIWVNTGQFGTHEFFNPMNIFTQRIDMKVVTVNPKVIKNKDFDWFKKNYPKLKEQYADKWIAIVDEHVVSSSDTFIGVLSCAMVKVNKTPYITRISPERWEK